MSYETNYVACLRQIKTIFTALKEVLKNKNYAFYFCFFLHNDDGDGAFDAILISTYKDNEEDIITMLFSITFDAPESGVVGF